MPLDAPDWVPMLRKFNCPQGTTGEPFPHAMLQPIHQARFCQMRCNTTPTHRFASMVDTNGRPLRS
jgi:hypothetical protein